MKRKLLSTMLCVGLVGSMMFTGCGSSDSTSGTDTAESSGNAQNEATTVEKSEDSEVSEDGKELEKLSIQLSWLPQGEFMGYYVAQAKGYYETNY